MFDKLKQLKELRDLQKSMQQQKVEIQKRGVRVVLSGNMKLEEVSLNPELSVDEQGLAVREAVNEAIEKLQSNLASSLFK